MESAVEIARIQLQLEQKAADVMEKNQQFLPWPSIQPALNVPHFDREMYKNVDLAVEPSERENGLDLPFDDIATLRFFFNLGVQQCRAVLLSQLHDHLLKEGMQLRVTLPSEQRLDDVSTTSTSSSTPSDSPSSTCSSSSSCRSCPNSVASPSAISAQSEQRLSVFIPEIAPDFDTETVGLLKCADA